MNEIMKEALLSFIKNLKEEIVSVQENIEALKEDSYEAKKVEEECKEFLEEASLYKTSAALAAADVELAAAQEKKKFYDTCIKKQEKYANEIRSKIVAASTLLSTL